MAQNANNNNQTQDINQLLKVRREKLAELQAAGKDPFAITKFDVTNHSNEIKEDYEKFEGKEVTVAGRMMQKRVMGKASFCNLQDLGGSIQAYVARDNIGEEAYKDFKRFDVGDIIGISGTVFKTQTGEISIHATAVTLLSKSLQVLPEKFHGLTNTDLRYRQRYVDLIMNQDVKETFVKRSKIISEIRRYLDERGFIEVETPMLVQNAGGAAARPFESHYNALDLDIKLRISLELYLKRLIVGGLEKVYEIGRVFRNEGLAAEALFINHLSVLDYAHNRTGYGLLQNGVNNHAVNQFQPFFVHFLGIGCRTCHKEHEAYQYERTPFHYPRKLRRIPAATAEPITPATFGAMAWVRRWLEGSASRPTVSETRAASGTAETPALPMRGLIFLPSGRNRFMNLAKLTPKVVAITKDARPRPKMRTERPVRNTSAWVDAPTVRPMSVVTTSISDPPAVAARRFVTPLSFRRFPKNSIPSSGRPLGTMKAVQIKPMMGNTIFSLWLTSRGFFMRIASAVFIKLFGVIVINIHTIIIILGLKMRITDRLLGYFGIILNSFFH